MANLRSRRTVSRGNTPQSPARRIIQSSSASPQTRQQARSSSRDITTTSRVGSTKPNQVLAAVQEQEDIVEATDDNVYDLSLSVEDGSVGSEADDDVELEDDSDIASEFERENRLKELDRDLIIDSLPAIHQKSTKILSLFSPDSLSTTLEEIKSANTSVGKRFVQFKKGFDTDREPCSTNGFLDVDLIVRKLVGSQGVTDGQWRPDAILYMANLVVLVSSMTTGSEQGIYDTLEKLYNNFPSSSLLGVINDDEGLAEQFGIEFVRATIDISISIRTQFFLQTAHKMIHQASFDPDGILKTTFFEEDGGIRGYDDYSDHEIMIKKVSDSCAVRIEEIRRYFSSDINQSIDLDGLARKYTWKDFVSSIVLWATQRNLELVAHISRQGGVDAITKRLNSIGDSPSDSLPSRRAIQHQPLQTHDTTDEPVAALSPIKTNKTQIEETPMKATMPRPSTSKSRSKSKQINRLKELKASRILAESEDTTDNISRPQPARVEVDEAAKRPINSDQSHDRQHVLQNHPQSSKEQVVSIVDDYDELPMAEEEDVEIEESRELSPPRTEPRRSQSTAAVRARAARTELTPVPGTAAVLAREKEKRLIANKENIGGRLRFTDPQQDAVMERWEDTPEPRSPRKHSRGHAAERDDDNEDEEDDGFETDTRRPRKSRRLDTALSHRPGSAIVDERTRRERSASDPDIDDILKDFRPPQSAQPTRPRSPPAHSSQGTANRNRQPSSSAPVIPRGRGPIPLSQAPPASQVQQVNAVAKMNVRRFAVSEKKAQGRRKWGVEETNRLIDLVGEFGCAWARIKEEDKESGDPMLIGRDQVALKDKARNIKMDYLKACTRLPDGFSKVSIKQSDIDKLTDLGIPYGERDGSDEEE